MNKTLPHIHVLQRLRSPTRWIAHTGLMQDFAFSDGTCVAWLTPRNSFMVIHCQNFDEFPYLDFRKNDDRTLFLANKSSCITRSFVANFTWDYQEIFLIWFMFSTIWCHFYIDNKCGFLIHLTNCAELAWADIISFLMQVQTFWQIAVLIKMYGFSMIMAKKLQKKMIGRNLLLNYSFFFWKNQKNHLRMIFQSFHNYISCTLKQ